jgi:hypothetical protein
MTASPAALLWRDFAKPNITSERAIGTAGISQRLRTIQLMGRLRSRVRNSSFELVELIDVCRSIVAVNGDDERKTHRCFSRGNSD